MTHYTRYCSRTNERADFLRTMPVVGTFKTCVDVSQRRWLKNIFQAVGTKIENFVLIRFVTEIRHTHMLKYSPMGSRLNPHHLQWYYNRNCWNNRHEKLLKLKKDNNEKCNATPTHINEYKYGLYKFCTREKWQWSDERHLMVIMKIQKWMHWNKCTDSLKWAICGTYL